MAAAGMARRWAVRAAPTARATATALLEALGHTHGHVGCPACAASAAMSSTGAGAGATDYAFEVAASNIRYGRGVTREVGMDLRNINAKNVLVMTDPLVAKLPAAKAVVDALTSAGVSFTLYDTVRVEPSDQSFKDAIAFAKRGQFDAYVAVGGGSVMDTCKAANLYASHPEADFLDFVNAPIGKGKPVTKAVKPLFAVPTTAGTGSETTGTAIFDFKELGAKTGITSRAIKPHLGLIDPDNTQTMPREVRAASGLDVLCHALESYTALPYHQRRPRPANPMLRPGYQGSNPVSDMWSLHALSMCVEHLPRSVRDLDDHAQSEMVLAATYAGIGFGNAGVHLCHGLSYPISGLNKKYWQAGYQVDHPLIPHGISVAITAPAVFEFTAPTNPERHLRAAAAFGANVANAKQGDAGRILADALREFLSKVGVPDGLKAFGYSASDIPRLAAGAMPQQRVLQLSPSPVAVPELSSILERSMTLY